MATKEKKKPVQKAKFKVKIARAPNALNLIRITLLRRGTFEPTLVGEMVYSGAVRPDVFGRHVAYTAKVAANTISNLFRCKVVLSEKELLAAVNGVAKDMAEKISSAMKDAHGRAVLHTLPNGVIPSDPNAIPPVTEEELEKINREAPPPAEPAAIHPDGTVQRKSGLILPGRFNNR